MTAELVPMSNAQNSLDLVAPAFDLAEKIAKTDFVPSPMRGKPEAVLAAILTGHELGIGPMQSLAKIHVIEGRPAMAAELMRALVLAAGHDIWVVESNSTRCTVGGKRTNSERESTFTWTLDDARKAGLDGRQNWRKYPRAMLLARATSEVVRAVFPDVVAGVSYSVEELTDGEMLTTGGGPLPPAEPVARKARARRAATEPPEIVDLADASSEATADSEKSAVDVAPQAGESDSSESDGDPPPASPAAVPPELLDYSGDPF